MYDRDTAMLEKYDLTVKNIRKVRGGWLCIASEGLFLWKESVSGEERLDLEDCICRKTEEMGLAHIWSCAGGSGRLRMDRFVRNKEGNLLTADDFGRKFVLKEWTEGHECDVRNKEDLFNGARAAACMHQILRAADLKLQNAESAVRKTSSSEKPALEQSASEVSDLEQSVSEVSDLKQSVSKPSASLAFQESYLQLWERRKREICRISGFVRKRRNKNALEQLIMKETPYYLAQAQAAIDLFQAISGKLGVQRQICHGDFHYHNLVYGKQESWICQSSRFQRGYQIADFYLFLRKCMEKQDFNWQLAKALMEFYQKYCPVTREEGALLYCLFLFPEKYWKQLNFYAQSNKAWMPEKNVVKLRNVINQEEKRQVFLENLHRLILPF
ncbi:MAG: hypothetical protein Q4F21_01355 [Lachnospiraceae bacterium]|nr:hypothetical protein [Lachnospiraceae bacterium]